MAQADSFFSRLLHFFSASARRAGAADRELAVLTEKAYESPEEAFAGILAIENYFLARSDQRARFATVYRITTGAVLKSIEAGQYENAPWMRAYQTEFGNHYRLAVLAQAKGNPVPAPWAHAFEQAQSSESLILQDVLLGMNAHINYDLAFALEHVKTEPQTALLHADHTKVNKTLSDITDALVRALAEIYQARLYSELDKALGPTDELLLSTGMAQARENGWRHARLLAKSRPWNRWFLVRTVAAESTAAAIAIRTLTLPPPLAEAIKGFETGLIWRSLEAALDGAPLPAAPSVAPAASGVTSRASERRAGAS